MTDSLFAAVRARIADPASVFIETPEGRRITYGDVVDISGRMAAALVACGVEPDARVAVQVDKSPEMVLLYLAILRAGAVLLPLNVDYTLAETEYFLTDAEPALVVCRPKALEAMRALGGRLGVAAVHSLGTAGDGSFMAALGSAGGDFTDVPRRPKDLAAILYTSGTTGRSKGAMLTHENLVSNAVALVETWRFTAQDVLIHALPIFHTHGLFVAINVTLFSGASMIFLPKFDAGEILRTLPRATCLMGVPTFYVRLLDRPGLTRDATAHMRLFVSGSAPLLAETHAAFLGRTGHAILERYGMTETGMITSNPYDGERIAGTVGFPLPHITVRVRAADDPDQAEREAIGVLEVKGPNVFSGYWRQPEKTAAEFRSDGFFVTGDLGRIDACGYVHIVGRSKDLIISGGFNVYPKEIEAELDALEGVRESAVIGVPHPDFGEGVTAVVVPESSATLGERGLLAQLDGRLAKYKLPKRLIVVDELPRNAMGKVQKAALRERYARLYGRPPGRSS